MVKIGVGITSYNRPECLKECLEHIYKHTKFSDFICHVAFDTDEDRKGVAYRKNECLRALKDCDYVFLFDDDCYPIKDGWVEFFVNASKASSFNHFLYLNESHNKYEVTNYFTNKINASSGTTFSSEGECSFTSIAHYKDCGGVFMFMTKECIDKVGAFNEKFNFYGFEHCDWSMRASNKNRNFNMVVGTDKYIYSHDYSTPNHKSSITDEEKQKCIKNNWDKFFKQKIENIYIPL